MGLLYKEERVKALEQAMDGRCFDGRLRAECLYVLDRNFLQHAIGEETFGGTPKSQVFRKESP